MMKSIISILSRNKLSLLKGLDSVCLFRSVLHGRRVARLSTSSLPPVSGKGGSVDQARAAKRQRSRRRRHDFETETIPPFHEFLQQQSIRNMYRQFLRLIRPLPQRRELEAQIRHQFRMTVGSDKWEIKRAMSEGSRRLKELSAMVSNSVGAGKRSESVEEKVDDTANHAPSSSSSAEWPWSRQQEISSFASKPLGLPSRSNLK